MGTTTTVSQPWSGQAPYLENVNQQAAGLYGAGAGFNPYAGPKYAGLDPMQQQGMGMIQNAALNPQSIGNQAGATYGNVMQGGAYNPSYLSGAMQPNNVANPGLSNIASQQYSSPAALGGAMQANAAATPGVNSVMNSSYLAQPYSQGIIGTANGAYLGSNPYLDQVYNTAARKATETYQQSTMPGIRAGAQGAGMGASSRNALAQGQATGMYGQGLQDLAGNLYGTAYENERNRMLQAAGLGQQGYQAQQGFRLSGAQTLGAQEEANRQRQMQGANLQQQGAQTAAQQQLQALGLLQAGGESDLNRQLSGANLQSQNNQFNTNAQLQAAGMAPGAANWGAQQLMNLGGINQGMAQQELTGMQDYWNQMQQSPWNRLGAYSQAVGGQGITQGSQSTSYPSGGILPALGGAATGAALGGMLPTEYSWLQPYLAAGGGYLGYRG